MTTDEDTQTPNPDTQKHDTQKRQMARNNWGLPLRILQHVEVNAKRYCVDPTLKKAKAPCSVTHYDVWVCLRHPRHPRHPTLSPVGSNSPRTMSIFVRLVLWNTSFIPQVLLVLWSLLRHSLLKAPKPSSYWSH